MMFPVSFESKCNMAGFPWIWVLWPRAATPLVETRMARGKNHDATSSLLPDHPIKARVLPQATSTQHNPMFSCVLSRYQMKKFSTHLCNFPLLVFNQRAIYQQYAQFNFLRQIQIQWSVEVYHFISQSYSSASPLLKMSRSHWLHLRAVFIANIQNDKTQSSLARGTINRKMKFGLTPLETITQ